LADECANQHIYLHPDFNDHCRDLERLTSLHVSRQNVTLVASIGTNSVLMGDHCVTYNRNKVDNIIR